MGAAGGPGNEKPRPVAVGVLACMLQASAPELCAHSGGRRRPPLRRNRAEAGARAQVHKALPVGVQKQRRLLGRGRAEAAARAQVYKALLDGVQEVAVKVFFDVHSAREEADILREVAILKGCRDRNVVQFYGACHEARPWQAYA
jgi:hypothetical protein